VLYLDSSALVKRYSNEKGSRAVVSRFESGETIFTSMLSFGEVHSSFARKFRSNELSLLGLARLRENFLNDWLFSLSILELDSRTMSELPRLVEQYDLRAGDAVHLSAAFWLKDTIQLRRRRDQLEERIEFGVADKRLARVAEECGFQLFNPEDEN
jgi:predicted nucleic acid-binding protein